MDRIIRIINLPESIRGFVIPDQDGVYNIYINAKMNFEMQRITYQHEINHIKNNDPYSDLPVVELEDIARYFSKKF